MCARSQHSIRDTISIEPSAPWGFIKGSAYLTELSNVKAIMFDKTGTLTNGRPEIHQNFIFEDENTLTDMIVTRRNSNATRNRDHYFEPTETLDIETTNHIGKGLEGTYNNDVYRIGEPTC